MSLRRDWQSLRHLEWWMMGLGHAQSWRWIDSELLAMLSRRVASRRRSTAAAHIRSARRMRVNATRWLCAARWLIVSR